MRTKEPVVKINGMVKLFSANDMVVRAASDDGQFEPETFQYWLKYLKQDHIALDVGAYTGLYAIAAHMHGCISHAFEPNDLVYSRLRDSIDLNRAYGVQVHHEACSDRHGMMNFVKKHIPLTSAGSLTDDTRGIPVSCRMLDSFFPSSMRDKVCAIKIDVEGHEVNVLRGASTIIQSSKPLVIAEFLSEEQKASVVDIMSEFGYDSYMICDDRNLIFGPTGE